MNLLGKCLEMIVIMFFINLVYDNYMQKVISDLIFFCPQVMVPSQDTDRLQGFAKTHVITEDAVHLVLVEKGQPVDTVLIKIKNNMKNWMNQVIGHWERLE